MYTQSHTRYLAAVLVAMMTLAFSGCKSGGTASINQNASAPASPERTGNANGAPAAETQTAKPRDPSSPAGPELVGAYELQEVHKEGVVGIMSELKTRITFNRDGTYSRVSTKAGKQYHVDTGGFRIEPPGKLVLSVQLSDRNIQTPPVQRSHKFVLSQDGDELRLTSDKGKVAVFKRVAKPAGN